MGYIVDKLAKIISTFGCFGTINNSTQSFVFGVVMKKFEMK